MEVALLVENILVSNTNDGSVLFIATKFIRSDMSMIDHPSDIKSFLAQQTGISVYDRLRFHIEDKFLTDADDSETMLQKASKVIHAAVSKDIPVICWNAAEVIGSAFGCESGDRFDMKSVLSYSKLIDLKRLSNLVIDFGRHGGKFALNKTTIDFVLSEMSVNDYCNCTELREFTSDEVADKTFHQMMRMTKNLMIEGNLDTFADTAKYLNHPHKLKYMPNGKYAGMSVDDVAAKDFEYFNWLQTSSNYAKKDKDFMYTINQVLSSAMPDGLEIK